MVLVRSQHLAFVVRDWNYEYYVCHRSEKQRDGVRGRLGKKSDILRSLSSSQQSIDIWRIFRIVFSFYWNFGCSKIFPAYMMLTLFFSLRSLSVIGKSLGFFRQKSADLERLRRPLRIVLNS
jgi:hypothetical protein